MTYIIVVSRKQGLFSENMACLFCLGAMGNVETELQNNPEKLSRAALIRGGFKPGPKAFRPPWARYEQFFTDTCERDGHCIQACPEKIIIKSSGGFPVIDFGLGECTFCKRCVKACPSQALSLDADEQKPWQVSIEITEKCLSGKKIECRICIDQCEPGALFMKPAPGGPVTPEIIPEQCTGCGACVRPCPVKAIKVHQR